MATLPMIPRKHIKPNGRVDLWDVLSDGGPFKVEFTTINAREALLYDKDRYKFELPRGTKQGPAQDEADERAAAEAEESAETQANDPHYGRKQA